MTRNFIKQASTSNRFQIALSFPGEHRDFVLKVAEELAARLTRERVFYDEWYETELLGVGGDLKLQSMYEQADLVVPFFSEYYSKSWCSLEWETIRGILLKQRKKDAVIPVHLDDTDIPGWSTVNFGIRLRGRTPQEIADIIYQRLVSRNFTNVSQQERIEELIKKLEAQERSYSNQLKEIEATFQQEKEDLKRILYYICNLHKNDHILNHWEKIYIIDAKGGLKEKERMSIAPIPNLDKLFFYTIKRGVFPCTVPRVLVKSIKATNTKNNNELEIVEICRDTRTIEYVIVLDPPATAQKPVEFEIESYRPDIFKPLIDKLNDNGGFRVKASSLSNAKVKIIAPRSLEITSFSISPMVGNYQITDDEDGRSSITWEAPRLEQGLYSYVIQAKKK